MGILTQSGEEVHPEDHRKDAESAKVTRRNPKHSFVFEFTLRFLCVSLRLWGEEDRPAKSGQNASEMVSLVIDYSPGAREMRLTCI